jgi:hydrogenase small subunit
VINISGCPPIPEAMTGTLAHVLTFGRLPDLDVHGRPLAFFGNSIHDRCYRRSFYDKGLFAKSFDDEGARKGWCLYEVGCKGPVTYNACSTLQWNGATSWPVKSGHGCLGCSEPDFWDRGSFYKPLPAATAGLTAPLVAGAAAGVAAGVYAAREAAQRRADLGVKMFTDADMGADTGAAPATKG